MAPLPLRAATASGLDGSAAGPGAALPCPARPAGVHCPDRDRDRVAVLVTAVSAICVTGLVTVDTAVHWSPFGLTVIMLAMKVGGLGVLTVASLLSLSVMRRMGLAQRLVTAEETRTERLSEVGGVL